MKLIFAFENCQNSFSWGPPFGTFCLQNTLILEVKAVRLGFCLLFCLFDSGKIHIDDNKKPGFTFSLELGITSNIFRVTPVGLSDWVFDYELCGCGFESHCSHLNFRFLEFLDIQATIECGITLKRLLDMIKNIQSNELYR